MLISIVVFSMVIVSSCNKEDELKVSENTNKTMTNARLNPELSNEEMEESIINFMDKLENPGSYEAMNYEEAFDYIEATLNFKYINYDYSKCANTKEFTSSIELSINSEGNMKMVEIATAYDAILKDWHEKYYSIEESSKTPLVFNITEVTETAVRYSMTVGYGFLDLSLWGEEFVPATLTDFDDAKDQYNNKIYSHLNNTLIEWTSVGNRVYIPTIDVNLYIPALLPSYGSDPLPNDINFCDYQLFWSKASFPTHHYQLNLIEYNFYYDQAFVIMLDHLSNNSGVNYVSLAYFKDIFSGIKPNYTEVKHLFKVNYGKRYSTQSAVSTL